MDNTTQKILDIMQAEVEEHEARIRMVAIHINHQRQRANFISHHGRSIVNHRVTNHNKKEGHTKLYHDYFSNTPTYTKTQFRR